MTSIHVLGVDPGATGAIASIHWTRGIGIRVGALVDMPMLGKFVDPGALAPIMHGSVPDAIAIEKVSARPGQGVTSMFNFGASWGTVRGACGQTRIIDITPASWKKAHNFDGKDKDEPRLEAIRRYGNVADELRRKKDQGRADAIWIGVEAVRLLRGERGL